MDLNILGTNGFNTKFITCKSNKCCSEPQLKEVKIGGSELTFYYFMQTQQVMSVRDALGYEFIKTNPIQTEAQNILNRLFQDDFGFFDSGKANRVEWFLPKAIKDMKLFLLCFDFSNESLVEASIEYSNEEYWDGKMVLTNKRKFYISKENKVLLQREVAKILEVPFFKQSYTFCDILKNPLFTKSFDGNEPIAMSIIMECTSSTYETTQEMISVMNGFLSEKLHFNGNYSFFDKEIFVNISDVNDDICKNFKEVSFRAFDNDDIDTSFFLSNDLIEKLCIIEIIARRNIKILLQQEENEVKLQSIFR